MALVRRHFKVQPELLAAAKVAAGAGPSTPDAEVVRVALAKLAGLDPAPYMVKRGPRPGTARTA